MGLQPLSSTNLFSHRARKKPSASLGEPVLSLHFRNAFESVCWVRTPLLRTWSSFAGKQVRISCLLFRCELVASTRQLTPLGF